MSENNNRWISVNDELPTEQGYYLGYCSYWRNPYEILEYDEDLGDFTECSMEITHWQPLPAPPTGVTTMEITDAAVLSVFFICVAYVIGKYLD
ncbi:DUF551 domain-containing protein [Rodentibacter caecimuris]|uniref:DUF551 domain-containing protein n=1 Tax=Rodentibacter caecimuris TaxID=1796644 RepID=UPI0009879853|nr:hypothetical protein BKG97_01920 [Rodentibacter heylii]